MQKTLKILGGIGVFVAIVLAGIGVGWLASRGSPEKPAKPAPEPPPMTEIAPPVVEPMHIASRPAPAPAPTVVPVAESVPVATNSQTILTNWEDKLDDILGSDDDDTNKVQQLFAVFPRLPPDGQIEVAQHLSNLVEDDDYAPLGKLLTDPKLPPDVLDELMSDLLNRPNATKLPLFLDVAFTPGHPEADEAKDLLELYLEEDYGTDKAQWQKKIQEWLAENPD